jgi:hypothetical protein
MSVRYFVPALTLVFSLDLSGGTKVELDQSIALCKEAMEINASQLRVDEQQRERYYRGVCPSRCRTYPRAMAMRGRCHETGRVVPQGDRYMLPKVNVG